MKIEQTTIQEIYTNLDQAVKQPAARFAVQLWERPDGYKKSSTVHVGHMDSAAITEDPTSDSILVAVYDPVEPHLYNEHTIAVEHSFGVTGRRAEQPLIGTGGYHLSRVIKREGDEYSLSKFAPIIESNVDEAAGIPDMDPATEKSEADGDLEEYMRDVETEITDFDIAVLRRLATVLKES